MRIHRLRLQAFGPFKGTETIDFDALSAAGLFLLNGETGAGKTSVLDGICFALYGTLPGAREGVRTIRSAHADEETVPEAVCEFCVRERRFEVTRSPAWDRPKRRGTGTTQEKAQSRLRELVDGQWVVKSTRNDEVGAEIADILGMGRAQFTRVAMLPQGEFAAFLRAPDKERQALLESLFDVSDYRGVESHLAERRRRLAAAAREAELEHEHLFSDLADDATTHLGALTPAESPAGGGADGEGPGEEAEPAGDEQLISLVAGRLAEARAGLNLALASAQEEYRRLISAAEIIERRRSDAAALDDAERAQAEHDGRRAAVDDARTMLDADARAARVTAAAARRDTAAEHLAACRRGHAEARGKAESLEDAADLLAAAGADDGPLEKSFLARATKALTVAESLLPRERELADRRERLKATEDETESIAANLLQAGQRVEALDVEEARARAEMAEHAPTAAERAQRTAAVDEARRAVEAVTARDGFRAEHDAAVGAWTRAEREHAAARTEHAGLVAARLANSAAALAAELVAGEACAVCGSPDHPDPATASGADAVTDEQIAAAEGRVQERQHRAEEAARAKSDAEARMQRLAALAHEASAADVAAALDAAKTRAEAAGTAAEALQAAEQRIEQLMTEREALTAEIGRAREEQSALASRRLELNERIAGDARVIEEAAAPAATLAARVEQLSRVVHAAAIWEQALSRVGEAERDDARAGSELDASLAENGFETVEEARAGRLAEGRRGELSARVEAFDAAAIRLATLAESEQLVRARWDRTDGHAVPAEDEAAAARRRAEEAEQTVTDVVARQGSLDGYARRFEGQRDRLRALNERQGPLLAEYELVKGLADLAAGAGENTFKMPLSTYVLAARLEAVAAAANERLVEMTAGRFALAHDDAASGRGKGGLGIKVRDEWTGAEREPGSLSGGESFMASLALALGLADVVQAESGGIDMETLFVDEGFGSLDPATLEKVMSALDGLRTSGRVVGLVSHVQELKEQIAAQLVVHKTREGSTTTLELDSCGV
ncbi:AAA family ATPase [Zhihengliuella halotolerans]|uniref:Nuclease SbcCD subunit C n=1 Tax=Zhihengliuella halotolerans TaxID=370736 RepID=A0A4Q8ABX6_9MICC|nr:SMC family ATPase [Zhihengliuella halotolerans]RZU61638.1 exonuclease SbcC [Zhihengliuella halotolerans]